MKHYDSSQAYQLQEPKVQQSLPRVRERVHTHTHPPIFPPNAFWETGQRSIQTQCRDTERKSEREQEQASARVRERERDGEGWNLLFIPAVLQLLNLYQNSCLVVDVGCEIWAQLLTRV